MRIGYFLTSEEFTPGELVRQAKLAEDNGLSGLWISDHYHPWLDDQGQASFVWTVLGALAQACRLPIATAVTCPTVRIHPAVIAQAAATMGLLSGDRFVLGVGSGEALNEHIVGGEWPNADVRLEMLEEAVEVIRELFTGKQVNHRGTHYRVENARLYSVSDNPPPIYVSGFGRKSTELAGRIGDGYISTMPDAELLRLFKESGGASKPTQAGLKVCWARSRAEGMATAHRKWRTEQVPGELSQVLPYPAHFEQATKLVTPEMVGEAVPCGPDPTPFIESIRRYADAGFDELFVQQIGPDQDAFFKFYREELAPALSDVLRAA